MIENLSIGPERCWSRRVISRTTQGVTRIAVPTRRIWGRGRIQSQVAAIARLVLSPPTHPHRLHYYLNRGLSDHISPTHSRKEYFKGQNVLEGTVLFGPRFRLRIFPTSGSGNLGAGIELPLASRSSPCPELKPNLRTTSFSRHQRKPA